MAFEYTQKYTVDSAPVNLTDLKVDNLSATAGVSVAGDIQSSSQNGGPIAGTRNRIINGDMRIDQRNAGASVTPTTDGTYLVDRFKCGITQASKLTFQQSTTAPAGFTNSLKATVAAIPTIGATDYFFIQQVIEGYNVGDLGWGSSGASSVTLSFWVQSSVTGTFGVTIRSGNETQYYNFGYTIAAANTWQKITQTISGPTTGGTTAFPTGNTAGLEVWFGLGYGSTYTGGTQNAWTTGFVGQPTGATNPVSTSGATWYVTGVQLEPGTVATPFERRSYGQELALCQRYFETTYDTGVAPGTVNNAGNWQSVAINGNDYYDFGKAFFKVTKRAIPTVTPYSTGTGASGKVRQQAASDLTSTATAIGMNGCRFYTSGATGGFYHELHFTASAEL